MRLAENGARPRVLNGRRASGRGGGRRPGGRSAGIQPPVVSAQCERGPQVEELGHQEGSPNTAGSAASDQRAEAKDVHQGCSGPSSASRRAGLAAQKQHGSINPPPNFHFTHDEVEGLQRASGSSTQR